MSKMRKALNLRRGVLEEEIRMKRNSKGKLIKDTEEISLLRKEYDIVIDLIKKIRNGKAGDVDDYIIKLVVEFENSFGKEIEIEFEKDEPGEQEIATD